MLLDVAITEIVYSPQNKTMAAIAIPKRRHYVTISQLRARQPLPQLYSDLKETLSPFAVVCRAVNASTHQRKPLTTLNRYSTSARCKPDKLLSPVNLQLQLKGDRGFRLNFHSIRRSQRYRWVCGLADTIDNIIHYTIVLCSLFIFYQGTNDRNRATKKT